MTMQTRNAFTPLPIEGSGTALDMRHIFADAWHRLPHVLRVLAENALRNAPDDERDAIRSRFLGWLDHATSDSEIAFLPGRIMMHDTTCGPALVDIAAMRDVLAAHGVDPAKLSPRIPVDVSTDHSSGVDVFARPDAFARNLEAEFRRNAERYRLMKWAGAALPGITVHPPGSGIMHTINLERLSRVVVEKDGLVYPDAMIGTDSHTPMINGLGILAWGVGGLEAEGALFGVPVTLRIPDVVGVKLTGALQPGVTATDLALVVTQRLRALGVTGDFVEFYGPGISGLTVGTRACVANMAPEYGASTGFFPVDAQTIAYLRLLKRPDRDLKLIETYAKAAGLWFEPDAEPVFTRRIELDLGSIEPSVAGPRRPQDRRPAGETATAFAPLLAARKRVAEPEDGAVAIAAITSCTNTSDHRMLITAGLLAKAAAARGLQPPAYVKTSLAPGSPTAEALLERANLLQPLESVGFGIVGYGCTTCIGNSGRLTPEIATRIGDGHFRPVAVLSGNRNFPGRVHPDLEFGYLASPPLVIAFALAGTINIDITRDPLGVDAAGQPVRLADLWPSEQAIDAALGQGLEAIDVADAYGRAASNPLWLELAAPAGAQFPWDLRSTYLRSPPFARLDAPKPLANPLRALLVLGDDITTDHISPAGAVKPDSETARYLVAHGENPDDLNVHAARRGNFESMVRGAFTNKLVKNLLGTAIPPGMTVHGPSGDVVPLSAAAERYRSENTALIIVAGERYGMGSSRDWAAKAVALLGVRAVLAVSFERIHRTNLIGMGILPLLLPQNCRPEALRISPQDRFYMPFDVANLRPRGKIELTLRRADGSRQTLTLRMAIETSLEVSLLQDGGLIPHVLNRVIAGANA